MQSLLGDNLGTPRKGNIILKLTSPPYRAFHVDEFRRVWAGNVLYLKTERESSSYFNLIKAVSDGENTFVLAGDGTLRMYKVRKGSSKGSLADLLLLSVLLLLRLCHNAVSAAGAGAVVVAGVMIYATLVLL